LIDFLATYSEPAAAKKMMKIVLLSVAAMLAACRPQPQAPHKPVELGWRIKWETSREQSPGKSAFRVMVHSLVSGRYVSTPIDHEGVGSGVAYVAEDPRQFFLVIESSGIDWKVSVEESVIGEPEER
jgi:hypothetical protein